MKIAIIPARGGSKRLPRKNILELLGRPLLHYPITTALKSNLFDRVIVSTEDDEIAETAQESGAEVMRRGAELAKDTSRVIEVCAAVLSRLADSGHRPELFCCLYATAVFLRPQDLVDSLTLLKTAPEADVVMGVSEFNVSPFQGLKEQEGFLCPHWPETIDTQSQFLPELVASNGTFYWARRESFLKSPSFYPAKLKGYKLPRIRAIDINTLEDMEFARIVAHYVLMDS